MKSSPKIAILGAGNWGTVLALLAQRACDERGDGGVVLFDVDENKIKDIQNKRENHVNLPGIQIPESILLSSNLGQVFSDALVIVPVVPSKAMREFSRSFSAYIRGDHLIIHGTKGFEPLTHKRMSTVIAEETGALRIGALAGPNLANELSQGLPSATIIASAFDEVQSAGQECFSSTRFKVETSADLIGVELIAALKNILALGSGYSAGIGVGQNAVGTLLTGLLVESQKIMIAMGAASHTVFTLAGFGDILATSTSELSRNFRAGKLLAQGLTQQDIETELKSTVEGLSTLKAAREIAVEKGLDLALIKTMWALSQGVIRPDRAKEELFSFLRPA